MGVLACHESEVVCGGHSSLLKIPSQTDKSTNLSQVVSFISTLYMRYWKTDKSGDWFFREKNIDSQTGSPSAARGDHHFWEQPSYKYRILKCLLKITSLLSSQTLWAMWLKQCWIIFLNTILGFWNVSTWSSITFHSLKVQPENSQICMT